MLQDMPLIPRRRFHRIVFLLAGIYNVGWGIYSSLDPQWLFHFSGMQPLNHPSLFACIGMIVGVYGILYVEVARRPEHGWLLAAGCWRRWACWEKCWAPSAWQSFLSKASGRSRR